MLESLSPNEVNFLFAFPNFDNAFHGKNNNTVNALRTKLSKLAEIESTNQDIIPLRDNLFATVNNLIAQVNASTTVNLCETILSMINRRLEDEDYIAFTSLIDKDSESKEKMELLENSIDEYYKSIKGWADYYNSAGLVDEGVAFSLIDGVVHMIKNVSSVLTPTELVNLKNLFETQKQKTAEFTIPPNSEELNSYCIELLKKIKVFLLQSKNEKIVEIISAIEKFVDVKSDEVGVKTIKTPKSTLIFNSPVGQIINGHQTFIGRNIPNQNNFS